MENPNHIFGIPFSPYSIQKHFKHHVPNLSQGLIYSRYPVGRGIQNTEKIVKEKKGDKGPKTKMFLNSERNIRNDLLYTDILKFIIEKNKTRIEKTNRKSHTYTFNDSNTLISKSKRKSNPPKIMNNKTDQILSNISISKSSKRSSKRNSDVSEESIPSEASIIENTLNIKVPNINCTKLKIVRSKTDLLNLKDLDTKDIEPDFEKIFNISNVKNMKKESHNSLKKKSEILQKYKTNDHPEIKILLTDYIEYIGSKISDNSKESESKYIKNTKDPKDLNVNEDQKEKQTKTKTIFPENFIKENKGNEEDQKLCSEKNLYKSSFGFDPFHFPKIKFDGPLKLEVSDSIEMADECIDDSNSNELFNPESKFNDKNTFPINNDRLLIVDRDPKNLKELSCLSDIGELLDKNKNAEREKEKVDKLLSNGNKLIKVSSKDEINKNMKGASFSDSNKQRKLGKDKTNLENNNNLKKSYSNSFSGEINNEEKGFNDLKINVGNNFIISNAKLVDYQKDNLILTNSKLNSKTNLRSKSSIKTKPRRTNSIVFSSYDSSIVVTHSVQITKSEMSINSQVASIQINPKPAFIKEIKSKLNLDLNSNSNTNSNLISSVFGNANNLAKYQRYDKSNSFEFVSCLSFQFNLDSNFKENNSKIMDNPINVANKKIQLHQRNKTRYEELKNSAKGDNIIIDSEEEKTYRSGNSLNTLYTLNTLNSFYNKKINDQIFNGNEENKNNINCLFQEQSFNEFNSATPQNVKCKILDKLAEYKKELNLLKEELLKIKQFNLNKIVN